MNRRAIKESYDVFLDALASRRTSEEDLLEENIFFLIETREGSGLCWLETGDGATPRMKVER